MADKKIISEAGQKQVEQLNEQLGLVEDQIINIGRRLNDDIKNKLSDLKDDTRAWTEAFANGENVISKVKNKLLTTQKDLNKLSLKRNDL